MHLSRADDHLAADRCRPIPPRENYQIWGVPLHPQLVIYLQLRRICTRPDVRPCAWTLGGLMQTIILDDHGHGWDAQSPTLRSFLHCPLPDFDFLAYVIENLGFVALTKVSPNAARMRFRPETASQVGIAAALYRVADMGLERVIISHPHSFVDRLFPNLAEAVSYISELLASRDQQSSAAFRSRERPIELLATTNGPLSSLFQEWMYSKQVYNSATLTTTLA